MDEDELVISDLCVLCILHTIHHLLQKMCNFSKIRGGSCPSLFST